MSPDIAICPLGVQNNPQLKTTPLDKVQHHTELGLDNGGSKFSQGKQRRHLMFTTLKY